jgi:large subunit ribosomal protein L15
MANLNSIVRTSLRPKTRVGRGGKRGKTAGRGTKGQLARAGRKLRPEMRDLIKKIPKLRGHGQNRAYSTNNERIRAQVVAIGALAEKFIAGEAVNPGTLLDKGLVSRQDGKLPRVKILSDGEIAVAVSILGCEVSKPARAKVEAAGGSIA